MSKADSSWSRTMLSVAHTLNVPVYDGETGKQIDMHKLGKSVIFGRMKGVERAKEKVVGEQGGDWRGLTDVSRATVVGEHHADLHDLIARTRKVLTGEGFQLVFVRDYYQRPSPAGYRGALTKWRHPNGHVCEVQFIDRHMLNAQEEGRKQYEQARSIASGAMHRNLTASEISEYAGLLGGIRRLFDLGWQRNSGDVSADALEKAGSQPALPDQAAYYDFEGTPAYQPHPSAPAYGLFGGEWKPVNRAAVHMKAQSLERPEFERLVAQACGQHEAKPQSARKAA